MAGENAASGEAKTVQIDDGGEGRERSSIGFPYNPLNDAVSVAQVLHENVGSGEADTDQISAWLTLSPKSSGFRTQMSASRMFGVIENGVRGVRLSQLGRMIVDPQRVREGRARAFMNVQLYKAVYDKYKGGVLPPAAAFERDIVGLGVAEKQKERARQVFERSADQAGFFESGRNRLVMPGFTSREEPEGEGSRDSERETEKEKRSGGGGGGEKPLNPFILGLLSSLPEGGKTGSDIKPDWPVTERVKWLQTAANIFDLMFKGDGGIKIEPAIAQRSPRPD